MAATASGSEARTRGLEAARQAAGPLALEAALLSDLRAEVESVRRDPSLLRLPLCVIVPSRSLRDHVAAASVRGVSASLAGVSIRTLHGFALSVIDRAGESPPNGARLFDALVRRAIRSVPELAELQATDAGPSAAAATMADFFDAGFTSEQSAALVSALEERNARRATRPSGALVRARALVGAIDRCAREMSLYAVGRPSAALGRAAAILSRDPSRSRARAIWIYGFSDATGLALELLATLRERCGARIYCDALLERVESPGDEAPFGARFRERLSIEASALDVSASPSFASFCAPTADGEAREVAVRVRALLDRGVRPESVGVIARDLDARGLDLRRELARFSLPFSGGATRGAPRLEERRAQSLAALLRDGAEFPVDSWLDLCMPAREHSAASDARPSSRELRPSSRELRPSSRELHPSAGELHPISRERRSVARELPSISRGLDGARADLATAWRALGGSRLADFASIDLAARLGDRQRFALPVHGAARADDEVDRGPPRDGAVHDGDAAREYAQRPLARRTVARALLERSRERALDLCRHLGAAPELAPFSAHAEHLRALVHEHLGWSAEDAGSLTFERALDELERDTPAAIELSADEFWRIAQTAILDACRAPLGGAGGGVQCLSLVEARARTFDHLFVAGLNQGVFPRAIGEDPLLPDELRRPLAAVLHDLPIKQKSRAEERFLFEQILRAASSVTLSWASADESGKTLAVSPFVAERLDVRAIPRELASSEPTDASDRELSIDGTRIVSSAPRALRPAHEHAVSSALCAGRGTRARTELARIFACTSADAREAAGLPPARDVARVRLAILDALDPPRGSRPALGAYAGFVGEALRAEDPRNDELWVTTLERMAVCPWQAFLERVLRVEPAPDPLAERFAIDARVVGIAVHELLARIAGGGDGREPKIGRETERELERVLIAAPSPAMWPSARALERVLADVARRVLSDEGLALRGLERVLIEAVRPYAEVARALDERDHAAGGGILGSEVRGSLEISDGAGGRRALHFRVDRVESTSTGPRLTDFKTGRPLSDAVRAAKREEALERAVARGERLQAAAYALAAQASGRYLHLGPDVRDEARAIAVLANESALTQAFAAAVESLARAWRRGAFFPRLVGDGLEKEPDACARCEVSSACMRGDSGARGRTVSWLRAEQEAQSTGAPSVDARSSIESVALDAWRLGRKTARADASDGESRDEESGA
jgi:hypothetical protein